MASVGPVIRIIAAAKTHFPRSVWCRLWYSNSSKTVSAFTYKIKGYRNFTYAASFVLCKLPPDGNIENHPLSVSVVSHIQDPITNEIIIQIPNGTYGFKTDIGVCVQPFHSHYDQVIIAAYHTSRDVFRYSGPKWEKRYYSLPQL